jgi:hypothetical protein
MPSHFRDAEPKHCLKPIENTLITHERAQSAVMQIVGGWMLPLLVMQHISKSISLLERPILLRNK